MLSSWQAPNSSWPGSSSSSRQHGPGATQQVDRCSLCSSMQQQQQRNHSQTMALQMHSNSQCIRPDGVRRSRGGPVLWAACLTSGHPAGGCHALQLMQGQYDSGALPEHVHGSVLTHLLLTMQCSPLLQTAS